MGDRVTLQGWSNYTGGLDVERNKTGLQSLYSRWRHFEIMFHVGTLLPDNKMDEQRVCVWV